MAAIIVVAGEKRRSKKRKSAGRQGTGQLDLDADGDGQIGAEELLQDFSGVHLRADVMLERVKLEDGLVGFLQQMPLFLVSLICFLVAISLLSPAEQTSAIHQHLEGHFGLDAVGTVSDVEGVYKFLKAFEEKNMELRPTSPNYWCEHRYFQYVLDDHYQIPRTVCNSPRRGQTVIANHFKSLSAVR